MNFKEAILGSGISSYIYFKSTSEKATVFSSKKSLTIKSKNFYQSLKSIIIYGDFKKKIKLFVYLIYYTFFKNAKINK